MTLPWSPVGPLSPEQFAHVRRRAIFDCCKWDPQVEDVCTIADVPIVLTRDAWLEVGSLAESLSVELAAAEQELVQRPELHHVLGLPRPLTRAIRPAADGPTPGIARIVRFDFHHTLEGWRISEANSDVPGGLNEASGLPGLMLPHVAGASCAGDVAGAYASALAGATPNERHVALVHATAYTDDRQVMIYLARRLEAIGVRVSLVSPAHLRWQGGRVCLETDWAAGSVDAIARFFPAEWLPNLPFESGWSRCFHGGQTPVSNPACAVLTQSKRFPLAWDSMRTPMPTWRRCLPETRDPRKVPWRDGGWVLKPALGRIGEGVGVRGVTARAEWDRITRSVARDPAQWAAQRQFDVTPYAAGGRVLHPCIGVYTIDGRVAGAYGRISSRPLIDAAARDAAVLVESNAKANQYASAGSPVMSA
jgi:hypothetical protein